jgi:hypothetical protein
MDFSGGAKVLPLIFLLIKRFILGNVLERVQSSVQ